MCSNNYDNLGLWMMLLLSSIVLRKLGKTIGYSMSYYLYASSVLELLFAIRAVFSSSKKSTMRKKDSPSHQTCHTCMEY
jgi:hypothetical protein